ncbi:ferredoxin [Pseudonocardia parietis]|uniref:Ferredoxin n=1 Tax=Pseudonocardia parietis TaxID=570936 RepID=A0ABS4VK98_9PSEU|nr:ferredoxin [Pseudonocardia parietis]MBP2364330.1 NAD-dependent dihydropyrimidine dehydrogenase PreA subunit [Pseudonocardia parietis]
MAFVIGSACIDTMDRACMDECPVDCIYEGDRKLYINPVECIDCGACVPACPMDAISNATTVSAADSAFVADNAAFFTEPLPGRDSVLGNPGGATKVGRIGLDTHLVGTF